MGKATCEEWRPIVGYEGLYEVSNLGRVRSLKRYSTKGKVISLYESRHNGYVYVTLSKHSVHRTKRVHKLVLQAFCPIHDKEKNQIDHIDGDKKNNVLTNLEWVTGSENMKRAFANGQEKVDGRKVIDLDTLEVFESATAAAKSAGSDKCVAILRVCNGKRSQYRNRHFAFYEDYINGTIPEFRGKRKRRSSVKLWR